MDTVLVPGYLYLGARVASNFDLVIEVGKEKEAKC